MRVHDLPTPALVIERAELEHNVGTMAATLPGAALRPHVKAHKCTALAAVQLAAGHRTFTCATPREVLGMAAAGLGDDLLLANEVLDPQRLHAMAVAQDRAMITVAVDSPETVAAAADAGLRHVLVDVNVGLPRCGCAPDDAGRIADLARSRGLVVRGVMGYEGHLMMADAERKRVEVAACMDRLLAAHALVGGDIISAGGTGTYHLHDRVTEVQAGSYALMDTQYATLGLPFRQACFVIGTVVSVSAGYAVADVGLKALGMDHGNPSAQTLAGDELTAWFFSDEHVTFATTAGSDDLRVGGRVRIVPAHIDPTMAMHDVAWLVVGTAPDADVLDRWPIDLRGW